MRHMNPPSHCDICGTKIVDEFSDAAIIAGGRRGWANCCPECATARDAHYGTGQGQRYQRTADNQFEKVAG